MSAKDLKEAITEAVAGVPAREFAKVELMGHRSRVGEIEEVERFGATMLRVDFYDADTDQQATEYYNGASIYCLSPVSEEVVIAWDERQKSYRRPAMRQLPALEPDDPYADEVDPVQ